MPSPAPTDDPRDAISRCAPFADLPPDAADEIARRMVRRTWRAGDALIRQGDTADWLLLVDAGAARVDVSSKESGTHTVARVGPSDLVGEMALLTRQTRMADVLAETDVSGWVLPAADFDDVAAQFPELGMVLTHVVADRLGGGDVDGLAGKTVERYRILRCAGRGGMAVVYEATDTADGSRVALKMMSHRLIYERGALSRFQREADLVQSIDHPHLVRVHRRFHAFRTHFIAMEFCDGPTLAQRVAADGPLPAPAVRRLTGEIASALSAMHARGVVHRDVKPSNVILTVGGAKLGDFGLAKSSDAPAGPAVTEAHTVVGTPQYMAPEVLAGDPGSVASDVYSLGCVAYEALTGRCPVEHGPWSGMLRDKRRFELPPAAAIGAADAPDLHGFLSRALAPSTELRTCDLARTAARFTTPSPGDGPA